MFLLRAKISPPPPPSAWYPCPFSRRARASLLLLLQHYHLIEFSALHRVHDLYDIAVVHTTYIYLKGKIHKLPPRWAKGTQIIKPAWMLRIVKSYCPSAGECGHNREIKQSDKLEDFICIWSFKNVPYKIIDNITLLNVLSCTDMSMSKSP